MFNLYQICLLREFDQIYMEFAPYKCKFYFLFLFRLRRSCVGSLRRRLWPQFLLEELHTLLSPFVRLKELSFVHDGVLSCDSKRLEDLDFERLEDFDLERHSFLGEELWREPFDDSRRNSALWRSLRERFRDSLAGLTLWAKRRLVELDLGALNSITGN